MPSFASLDSADLGNVIGGARRFNMSKIAKALAGPKGVYRGSPFGSNGSILEPLAKPAPSKLQFAPNGSVLEPLAKPF